MAIVFKNTMITVLREAAFLVSWVVTGLLRVCQRLSKIPSAYLVSVCGTLLQKKAERVMLVTTKRGGT